MRQLLVACVSFSVHANPVLVADLQVASKAASVACGSSLEVGVVTAGASEGASLGAAGAACAGEYAAAAAGAVLTWATSVMIMWATSTTTPPACGLSFDLGLGETCFNFPERSPCYQQCCQAQAQWCGNSSDLDYQQCLKDRACIYPNIREFSSEQLMFLHNDMDDLNDQYNDMVEQLRAINITQTIENHRWGDLLLACNNMLSSGQDFIDRVGLAQQHVSCGNPETLCSLANAEGAFQLQSSSNHQQTCFNFLGPCYSTCCEAQATYCGCIPGQASHCNTQCMHDRGCRATPERDTLQAEVCQHLDSCRTSMRMAKDDITNLHDCTLQMVGGGCSGSAVRRQFEMVTSQLNNTHTELEALESLAVGHGTRSLETLELISSVSSVNSVDLGQYWERARSEPFKIEFAHPSDTTPAPSTARDGSSLTAPAFWAILGSSLWVAVILRLETPKTSNAVTVAPPGVLQEPLLRPRDSGSLQHPAAEPQSGWTWPGAAQDTPEVVTKKFVDEFEKQIEQMLVLSLKNQSPEPGSDEKLDNAQQVEELKRILAVFKADLDTCQKELPQPTNVEKTDVEKGEARSCSSTSTSSKRMRKQDRQPTRQANNEQVAEQGWGFLGPLGPVIAMIVLYYVTPAPGPSTMQAMMSPEVDSDTLSHVYWDHVSSSMRPIITHLSSLEQSTCSRMLTTPISENVRVLFQYLTEVPH